jgi:outer membrane protein assembly factor BamA
MKNLKKIVVVLFSALVMLTMSTAALAADYSANTKQPVLTEALYRLEAMNNRKVLNVIQGQNSTGQPIKIMFRDLAALGYGTCEAVTAKSADGRLVILISSNYKTAPVEAIACLIAHESVHHENTKTYEEEVRAWTTEVQTWVAFTNANPSLKASDSKLVKRLNYLSKLYTKDGNQMTTIAGIIANQPAYASLKRS